MDIATMAALVGEIVITEAMVTGSPDLKGLTHLDNFAKSAQKTTKQGTKAARTFDPDEAFKKALERSYNGENK